MLRWFPALFLLLVSAAALAGDIAWPNLSDTCFVKGRPANADDVKDHCAVFVAMSEGKSVGKPLHVAIPQYAYHVDKKTGEKTPVILIQAEDAMGMKMAGFIVVGPNNMMVDLMDSLQLLGTKKPR